MFEETASLGKALMDGLSKEGRYEITSEMKAFMADFWAGYAGMETNAAEMKKIYEESGYLVDPHTGVAAAVYEKYKDETGDGKKTILASTASPYKFSRSVMEAVTGVCGSSDEFEVIKKMEELSGVKIPSAIEEIQNAQILHNLQCRPEEMKETVKSTFSKPEK